MNVGFRKHGATTTSCFRIPASRCLLLELLLKQNFAKVHEISTASREHRYSQYIQESPHAGLPSAHQGMKRLTPLHPSVMPGLIGHPVSLIYP